MSMRDAILNFNEQFKYEPEIENLGNYKPSDKYVLMGMGGSHLAAGLLQNFDPDIDIIIHRSYGLPALSYDEKQSRLFIASSYSGNTEEVVDGLSEAIKQKLNIIVIATGGKLIDIARDKQLPFVLMPDTGIQPRSALGFSLRGLLKIIGHPKGLEESAELATNLSPEKLEAKGKDLAARLKDHVPVIYASANNLALAYNWKIKFNETGKIPAFYNVFPELNHNEMTGFDVQDSSNHLSKVFRFIFIKDPTDDPRVLKRMAVLQKQYEERDLPVEVLELVGSSSIEMIFNSLLVADWTALHTAENYGLESEQVPMVEEFKKLIAS